MLQLVRNRAAAVHAASRLETHRQSALSYFPASPPDLIVTHFFLDCLTQNQVDDLARRLAPALSPNGLWLVSDFRIPPGAASLPAKVLVRTLYLAFRLLTGLRVTHLPDHALALTQAGLIRIAHRNSLFGILTTELWQPPTIAESP
jgi:hypothetical protein